MIYLKPWNKIKYNNSHIPKFDIMEKEGHSLLRLFIVCNYYYRAQKRLNQIDLVFESSVMSTISYQVS